LVAAQEEYKTYTSDVVFDADGKCTVSQEELDLTYKFEGTTGAVGSVTASLRSGNPQATASVPEGIELSKFYVITFNIEEEDFASVQITFSYADSKNTQPPYEIYKYIAESDSYVKLLTTVDEQAKTLTTTITSTEDPLFAVGGTWFGKVPDDATSTWVIVSVAIVGVIVVAFLFVRLRNSNS
jgi:hypothetical protein